MITIRVQHQQNLRWNYVSGCLTSVSIEKYWFSTLSHPTDNFRMKNLNLISYIHHCKIHFTKYCVNFTWCDYNFGTFKLPLYSIWMLIKITLNMKLINMTSGQFVSNESYFRPDSIWMVIIGSIFYMLMQIYSLIWTYPAAREQMFIQFI